MKNFTFPFFSIQLQGSSINFEDFLNSYFFELATATKSEFLIKLICSEISLPSKVISVESNVFSDGSHCYFRDTRGKLAVIDFWKINKNGWVIQTDPDFDPYYLYTFIIESIVIISLADKNIGVLHASAVQNERDVASVFAAWQNTGKTRLVLALTEKNVDFISDDYCFIKDKQVFSFPKKINLFSYNFLQFPHLLSKLNLQTRLRVKTALQLKKVLFTLSKISTVHLSKIFFRLAELAEIATNVQVSPQEIGIGFSKSSPLKNLFLIQKNKSDKTEILNERSADIVNQLATIMMYEQREFFHIYQKYTFLFPTKRVRQIEQFKDSYTNWLMSNILNPQKILLGGDITVIEQEVL